MSILRSIRLILKRLSSSTGIHRTVRVQIRDSASESIRRLSPFCRRIRPRWKRGRRFKPSLAIRCSPKKAKCDKWTNPSVSGRLEGSSVYKWPNFVHQIVYGRVEMINDWRRVRWLKQAPFPVNVRIELALRSVKCRLNATHGYLHFWGTIAVPLFSTRAVTDTFDSLTPPVPGFIFVWHELETRQVGDNASNCRPRSSTKPNSCSTWWFDCMAYKYMSFTPGNTDHAT